MLKIVCDMLNQSVQKARVKYANYLSVDVESLSSSLHWVVLSHIFGAQGDQRMYAAEHSMMFHQNFQSQRQ